MKLLIVLLFLLPPTQPNPKHEVTLVTVERRTMNRPNDGSWSREGLRAVIEFKPPLDPNEKYVLDLDWSMKGGDGASWHTLPFGIDGINHDSCGGTKTLPAENGGDFLGELFEHNKVQIYGAEIIWMPDVSHPLEMKYLKLNGKLVYGKP